LFELFLDYAPSVGVNIHTGTNYSGLGLGYDIYGAELGFRFWL
jgi:hypothetical protein